MVVIGLYSQCQKASFFPIFGGKFPISNQIKNRIKFLIFIMVKVGLKLSNIQYCIVSYNTSCNGDYKLTLQINSDVFLYLTIQLKALKIPHFWHFHTKIPNPRGMGHCPKMVKKALDFLSLYTARLSFKYCGQVYFVHSGLQDESLQVTISKLL